MPGRTPREALRAYVDPLQRALSCVSTAVLRHSGDLPLDTEKVLTTNPPATPLRGNERCFVSVVQRYRVIEDPANGPFRITTAYYSYMLENEDGEEIFGYHWHPDGVSPYKRPHLHLGNGARLEVPGLTVDRAHIPTGRVALEDFIEILITGFGVAEARDDWKGILTGSASVFRKYAKWW